MDRKTRKKEEENHKFNHKKYKGFASPIEAKP